MTDNTCSCNATKLEPIDESHSLNLYAHTDRWLQCQECGDIITRGIPDDHDKGMAFYDMENSIRYPRPECCGFSMYATKHWKAELAVQFKCSRCYRVVSKDPDDSDVEYVS